ncbi:MAG TPA: ATP-binding protein [Candidatus Nesterenkonia stercoripullorum]|uniref:ATP-binding protein n=1 Tax=Candidatus Nesterenkonia stercoripullorum TaxID=2838701 RepID=A0A9D2A858_9MICC|nr:ATP-binding protein [Candidatus Nesterenkonia stercoripullorum]
MRKPIDSPFSPGSDTVPQVWAGRADQLSDWRDQLRPRRMAGIHERGRTILGEAGLGKSSLVRRIAHQAAASGDWATPQLRIPSGTDPLKRVATALLDLAEKAGLASSREKRIRALLHRVETVAAAGVSLTLRQQPGPEPYTALTDLLIEIGRAALKHGDAMVMIHIDEVQNISDEDVLSQLLTALGDALTHEEPVTAPGRQRLELALPVAVYLTGLPEFTEMAGSRKGATFARRFKTTILEPVADDDFLAALQPFVTEGWEIAGGATGSERVYMEPAAQQKLVDLACGEPFLFQLAGERAWYADTSNVITAADVTIGWRHALDEAERHVQRILDRLPLRERQFLEAMAALPPENRSLTSIAQQMGYDQAQQAGPYSQRLDRQRGILARDSKPYRFRHRAVGAYLTTDWPDVS